MRIETLEIAGFAPALKGMRNPMNSWDKSDSYFTKNSDGLWFIGKEDIKLAQSLIKGGTEHCKFLRQIQVWADFDMPRYWWSEFDTYKIGTSANSCSTMHKLLNNKNPITIELFNCDEEDLDIAEIVINRLEQLRQLYRENKDDKLLIRAKKLLMEGFLQLRTVNLNYQTIRNIYHQRNKHRLKEEWIDVFCAWTRELPYFEQLIEYKG